MVPAREDSPVEVCNAMGSAHAKLSILREGAQLCYKCLEIPTERVS